MTQRVRLKMGPNEIEFEGERGFIDDMLKKYVVYLEPSRQLADLPKRIEAEATSSAHTATLGKSKSPAEFVREKQPNGGTETLLVLGRYLESVRGKIDFDRAEINALARDAKIKNLHPQYFTLGIKQGLLRTVQKGRYALTLSGEDVVLAMPKKKEQ